MNPLKILWIAPFPLKADVHPAPWLSSLAEELASAGHQLTILTASPRIAQVRDEIEIDQEIQGLKQHARGDRRRHLHDVPGYRVFRQILHGVFLYHTPQT